MNDNGQLAVGEKVKCSKLKARDVKPPKLMEGFEAMLKPEWNAAA